MQARIFRRQWWRVFSTLAVLAVLVKVVLPAGFMPDASRSTGLWPIVICTEHGPVDAFLNDKGEIVTEHSGQPTSKPAEEKDEPCAFGGAVAGHVPANISLVSWTPPVVQQVQPAFPTTSAPGRGLAAPPPPSHGPPILV